jgi:ADP-heptose:LPS heptosyltransferase
MRGHETSVDFQGLVKSAALGWVAGARTRYGFDRSAVREKASLLFTNRRVRVDQSRHVVEWNLELAHAVTGGDAWPAVRWDRFLAAGFEEFRGKVVLLPGAGRRDKRWPAASFARLAETLGDRALVVWGPGEEDLARAIGAPLAPRTNLRELATILRHADVVIGGDTGPLHLAAALGTRVVGLYGPTNPRRNGPFGQLDSVVSTWDGSRSIEAIPVDAVRARLQGPIETSGSK